MLSMVMIPMNAWARDRAHFSSRRAVPALSLPALARQRAVSDSGCNTLSFP
jgi:hypothetical protein